MIQQSAHTRRHNGCLLVLAFLVGLMSLTLPQQARAAAAIERVEIRGNSSVPESSVRAIITSRPGMRFSEERVNADIRALYDLGQFQDIRVYQRRGRHGLVLVYQVVEKSSIEAIEFEGNKKLDDDDLMEVVTVKPFTPLDPAQINESIQKMKEEYVAKGYQLVTIRHSLKSIPQSRNKKLVFSIKENQGLRVKRIKFIGNKAFSDKKLRKVIQTKQKSLFSWLSGKGKYRQEILDRDVAFLTFHYLNNGYLRVKISSPDVYLSRDRKWLYVNFKVEEGSQYRVGTVNVAGDILTTREELIAQLKTKPGQIYSRKQVEEDIQKLTEMYGNEAYAFANINPQTSPDDQELTADITFQIDKGSKIKIEKISFTGNTITRDKVLRRQLEVVENGYYHEARLRRSREKLLALGYFEEVNFATPRGSADNKINLNVRVKERSTGTFSIGAGFSSVENFILTASVSKDNFMGYGVSGRFNLELSSRRQLFLVSFEDPFFLDSNWIFSLTGYRTVNAFEDFDRDSFGGSLTFGRRLFDYSQVLLGYEIEDVKASDFRTTIPAPFEDNLSGLTSSLTLTLARDTRNNRLFPSKGSYVSVSNEFAGLGGSNRFYRTIGNARYYKSLFWKAVFKQNFTIGFIKSQNDEAVPLFERFFTGGINSLRGYELRSIGPSVRVPVGGPTGGDDEFVIGGNKLLLFNSELEFPIYEPAGFKFVIFYDMGNAFGEDQNFDLRDLRHNYGFGMRWNSPFGPMRFEWGIPIKKREGEDSVIFNFTIGSFF